jgi:aldose 1-epimerase
MTVEAFRFGELDGAPVPGFVIANRAGLRAKVIAYGARLTEMWVPDRDGVLGDVVLGCDDVDGYVATDTFFGATCGRYGNRIARGTFELDGRVYRLGLNDGPNHLHGGVGGFDRRLFAAEVDAATNSVVFALVSFDGEEGYPGELVATVRYRLTEDNVLEIVMTATTGAPTIAGMVHHSYWNLAGHASGDIRRQRLWLGADFYTPLDETLIPTGAIVPVKGTPYDYTDEKSIGEGLDAIGGVGFDNNFCLRGAPGGMRPVAGLLDPVSGRRLAISSNQPGAQVYSAGRFPQRGILGKKSNRYSSFSGIAIETQAFPNSPNVSHFPSVRLEPGQRYEHRVNFSFSAR